MEIKLKTKHCVDSVSDIDLRNFITTFCNSSWRITGRDKYEWNVIKQVFPDVDDLFTAATYLLAHTYRLNLARHVIKNRITLRGSGRIFVCDDNHVWIEESSTFKVTPQITGILHCNDIIHRKNICLLSAYVNTIEVNLNQIELV